MIIMAKPNLVERNKCAVKQHPDIQPREKPDDDANQLNEHRSHVKKHVSLAVGVEIKMIILTE